MQERIEVLEAEVKKLREQLAEFIQAQHKANEDIGEYIEANEARVEGQRRTPSNGFYPAIRKPKLLAAPQGQ